MSPVKSSSRKLAHSFDSAQFITIMLLLRPQPACRMCDRRADDFSRGARNRKVAEALNTPVMSTMTSVGADVVRTPATLIAVREDQLVPFSDMQALAVRLGGPTRLVEINSIFGHDAFLKESAILNPILQSALAE